MTKFPSLIEYIDEIGLDELHTAHSDEMKNEDPSEQISFSDYVEAHYEIAKDIWDEQMNECTKEINVPFNEEKDIALSLAIATMTEIINRALENKMVSDIILTDDMAPDYTSSLTIVEEFAIKVLPAIEKTLNELGA